MMTGDEFPQEWEELLVNLPEVVSDPWLREMKARFGEDLASFGASQVGLRKKARVKFSNAASMVFVTEALEQATAEPIAQFHASHFPLGVRVLDGTCGIGGDTLALAKDHQVIGYEMDPLRGNCARWNLKANQLNGTIVSPSPFPENEAIDFGWFDPSRRKDQQRLRRMEDYSPNPYSLVQNFASAQLIGIKLSPLDRDSDLQKLGPRVEFVSYHGQCLEAVVWMGSLIGGPGLERGTWAININTMQALEGNGHQPLKQADMPSGFIYEADPAAIRAHALGHFEMPNLGDRPGYLTCDQFIVSNWLKGYRVLEVDSFDLKRLKRNLVSHQYGVAVIKSRATGIVPEMLIKQLPESGNELTTLIFYESKKKIRVATTVPCH